MSTMVKREEEDEGDEGNERDLQVLLNKISPLEALERRKEKWRRGDAWLTTEWGKWAGFWMIRGSFLQ